MNLRPLHDRVVIERVGLDEKSKGGIIIPDNAKEKPVQGRVVAIGNGRINDEGKVRPLAVKEGQTILFNKYSGVDVQFDGRDLLILREDEILAIVD